MGALLGSWWCSPPPNLMLTPDILVKGPGLWAGARLILYTQVKLWGACPGWGRLAPQDQDCVQSWTGRAPWAWAALRGKQLLKPSVSGHGVELKQQRPRAVEPGLGTAPVLQAWASENLSEHSHHGQLWGHQWPARGWRQGPEHCSAALGRAVWGLKNLLKTLGIQNPRSSLPEAGGLPRPGSVRQAPEAVCALAGGRVTVQLRQESVSSQGVIAGARGPSREARIWGPSLRRHRARARPLHSRVHTHGSPHWTVRSRDPLGVRPRKPGERLRASATRRVRGTAGRTRTAQRGPAAL